MNQFVAPTSFITSISVLRAEIAVKTVFNMSTAETATRTIAASKRA
ncbi:uncharacterized protein METZ01_LOCUS276938 [marine metagenome]|uniref:Uncharacterized protein n=1 Tax=marine metagenome TaxID=408172 RepID=A0A382KGG4_9ZZZZ